jgi:hypothetical protein
MKLEQQVCSLELAKRLKELGVKQESHFYWIKDFDGEQGWCVIGIGEQCGDLDDYFPFTIENADLTQTEYYAAFTVAELGEMLPWRLLQSNLTITRGVHWEVFYDDATVDTLNGYQNIQTADTEANARAKMFIYLLENNLLTHPS